MTTENTDTNSTEHEQPKRQSIAERVCTELGIERYVFLKKTQAAEWKADRWRAELEEPGWQERFAAAVEVGLQRLEAIQEQREQEQGIRDGIFDALRYGPVAMAELTEEQMRSLVDPRLLPLADLTPEQGGIIICGPTEVGKTLILALATLRNVIKQATHPDRQERIRTTGIRWVRALDLPVARLSQGFGEGEADLVKMAKSARLLVLDDLAWESRRAGADDVIAEVIATRYDTGRPTWITTGLRSEQVVERYGEAFVRRIKQAGGKAGRVVDLWPAEARQ